MVQAMAGLKIRGRFSLSLALVITLSTLLVVGVLMTLVTLVDIRAERDVTRDNLKQRGQLLARTLNDVLADAIYISDVDALRDFADVVRSQPDVEYINIFRPDGRLLVEDDINSDGQVAYPTGTFQDDFALDAARDGETRLRFQGENLEVAGPIVAGSQVLGGVQFGFSADTLQATIRGIILRHVLQGLALVFIGTSISYAVARYVTRPLKELAVAAGGIGRGNLDTPIRPRGTTEVAELGNDLESMRVDLRRLYRGLEQLVDERTLELSGANEELQHTATALQVANKELETFSYSVSHDLRAPLRSLDGFSQILLDDFGSQLDEVGSGYLERIRANSQRMSQLIDDMLQLSRMSGGQIQYEQVDLSALVESICNDLKETQPDRDVTFVHAKGIAATGDPTLLRAAIENLLGNAWKYTGKHQHATIEFGSARENGREVYFVKDDGAGFDMAYADKLFLPFQRLHTDSEFDGTGIGLATVQRIIQRHGGSIWAEAELDHGATFYFTLS